MEKIIKVGEKDVKFAFTAGTIRRYRNQYNSELIEDLDELAAKLQKMKGNSNIEQFKYVDLEKFENIIYMLAKTADSTIKPIEDWLDDYESMSIYEVLPQVMELIKDGFISNSKNQIAPMEVVNSH